jgi:hypothetical protein
MNRLRTGYRSAPLVSRLSMVLFAWARTVGLIRVDQSHLVPSMDNILHSGRLIVPMRGSGGKAELTMGPDALPYSRTHHSQIEDGNKICNGIGKTCIVIYKY